ncbi:hypothetical protein LG324_03640 [Phycicoccus jejuensis]|uniref:hypothetical protein n=1 Tax=Phycicoccus TaxID=367298 RepID=UPI001C005470|nr:hypothetical protein [Phycicoccus mangrovi]MBT9257761.1 hypothetical protein [Phycicoccus mangrovi]
MTTVTPTTPALQAWREAIALLHDASDLAYAERNTYALGLWADLIGSAARNLLPSDQGHILDEIVLPPEVVERGFSAMVLAAEERTRAHPIEEFPPGASGVIVELCKLAGQVSP